MSLKYRQEFLKKYSREIQYIKSIKGKDYTVTMDDIRKLIGIKDVPWSNCLGFTVK